MNRNGMALLALGAGITVGAVVRATGNATLIGAAQLLQPIGALWLNALKMTLVPLVFAMVAKGMISLDRGGGGGRLLGITLPLLIGLLALAMAIGMGLGTLAEAVWPTAPGALAQLGPVPAWPPPAVPSMVDMIVGLIPANLSAAAGNGAMASIVVFAIIFGFAVSRTSDAHDAPLIRVIEGLAAAMICIVHWVLWFSPLGIFVLSLGLALGTGLAVAGLVAQIVVVTIAGALVAILFAYLLAWLAGGVRPVRFARAIIGAQAMAAGTCSSAATLPAMLEVSERKLGIPEAIGGAVLPLAVSIFRFAIPLYQGILIIRFTHAFGVPLDPAKAVLCGGVLILSNVGLAGLPGAAVLYASLSPCLQLLGLPLEIIPLMIAANALPDIFVTTGNVTADLAVTTVVARLLRRPRALDAPPPPDPWV